MNILLSHHCSPIIKGNLVTPFLYSIQPNSEKKHFCCFCILCPGTNQNQKATLLLSILYREYSHNPMKLLTLPNSDCCWYAVDVVHKLLISLAA